MAWKPPAIRGSDYTDPVDSDKIQLREANVGRSAFSLQKRATLGSAVTGVSSVRITAGNATSDLAFDDPAHAVISPDEARRARHQLGQGVVTLHWTIANAARVSMVEVAVFSRAAGVAVWSKTFRGDKIMAGDTLTFDGPASPFALSEDAAPYKFRVSIARGNYRRRPAARWVYLDVRPKTWVKVIVKNKETDAGVNQCEVRLTLPDTTALPAPDKIAGADGKVKHKAYQPEADYKVTEAIHPDNNHAWEVVSVVSED